MLVSSPDLTNFDYTVLLDLSGAQPSVTLVNTSVVINPASLQWVFEIYSPSGTAIYRGSFAAPDRTLWNTPFVQTSGFPRPYNQIEWSGKPYEVVVSVKDSLGNLFSLPKGVPVCRPVGNKPNDKNTYGTAKIKVTTRCRDAKILVEDNTAYEYQGITGVSVTSIFELRYPLDGTGTPQAPFVARSFSSALIPITQSGTGYLYYFTAVSDYLLGDGVTIRLKYIATETFPVYCNLDLSPVFNQLLKLTNDAQAGRCADQEEAARIIPIVTSKLLLACMAVIWPQGDVEPGLLLEEINDLTGWGCDCNTSAVTPLSTVGMDSSGQTYEVVSDGGDVTGSIEEIAGGIRIHIADTTYRFELCADNPSEAFSITPALNGQTKSYCFKVNSTTLADEILQQYESSADFKNRLNQLIVANLSNSTVSVFGRCVLPATTTFSYVFKSPAIASGQTYLLTQLTAGGVSKPLNFYFDRTNPGALTAALNATNIGPFSVTFILNVLTISISGIGSEITSFTGQLSGTDTPQELTATRTVSNSGNYSAGTIFQALIDFVCVLTLTKIASGQGFTVKDINLLTGAVVSRPIQGSDDLSVLLQTVITANNNIADYLSKVKGVDCTALRGLFPATPAALSDSAILYGYDNNTCFSVNAKSVAQKVLQLAAQDPDVKNSFCAAQTACGQTSCGPVTNASAVYDGTAQNITVAITNTSGALRYRLSYRPRGATSWLGTIEAVAAAGLTTAQVFGSVVPGVYDVQVIAICGAGEALPYTTSTQACGAPASLSVTQSGGNFNLTVGGLPASAVGFRIEITQPDGGSQVQNFTLSSLSVTMPVPTGIYGDFSLVARTICDTTNGWYSDPTGAVTATVGAPATCPMVTAATAINITSTTASIVVTKPVAGNVPTFYTLTYTPAGGSPISVTSSSGGSTITFSLTGLTPNKVYLTSVQSNCANGSSDTFYGDRFITEASSGANSSLNNSGTTVPSQVTLKINEAVVIGVQNMAAGTTQNFIIQNYSYAVAELNVCDASAIDAVITSGGQVHHATNVNNGVFFFSGIALTSPISVSFSNSAIP